MTDDEDKKEREIMQAIVQVIVQTPEFAEFYHGCEEQERRTPNTRRAQSPLLHQKRAVMSSLRGQLIR